MWRYIVINEVDYLQPVLLCGTNTVLTRNAGQALPVTGLAPLFEQTLFSRAMQAKRCQ